MSNLTQKNFATGHIELRVYGEKVSSYLRSCDGGMLKAASTEEPMGSHRMRDRHTSTREIEPLSLDFGLSGAKWVLQAAANVLGTGKHQRYNGAVVHADSNFVEQYTLGFKYALLTELTFPKLDAKSKEFASIKAKLQPEEVDFEIAEGGKMLPGTVDKQKMWLTSAFRLTLDGYKEATHWATSVEALTLKIGAKAYQLGAHKTPLYNPTKIEMPKLSFTVPLIHAAPLVAWFKQTVQHESGKADDKYQTTGSLEFLDSTRTKTVYEIGFDGVGIEACTVLKTDANQEGTKLMKFDCYVTSIDLKLSSGVGFI